MPSGLLYSILHGDENILDAVRVKGYMCHSDSDQWREGGTLGFNGSVEAPTLETQATDGLGGLKLGDEEIQCFTRALKVLGYQDTLADKIKEVPSGSTSDVEKDKQKETFGVCCRL